MKDVNIRVIELQDHVLSMYDRQISNYTQKEFQRCDARLESCPAGSVIMPCYVCLQTAQLDRPDVCREGINLVFNSRVAAVDKEQVTVINKCVMCMLSCFHLPFLSRDCAC